MYWCKRRIEVTVVGPEGIRFFDVDRPFLQIGSLAKSTVVVDGPGIPCRAYYLHATDKGLFCLRLAKECNGVELYQGWVRDEPLILGDYKITVRVAPPLEGMLPQGPPLDAKGGCHPPYPVIAIESDGKRMSAVCVRRSMLLVGRIQPSMLRLVSESVSGTHLVFYWDHDRLWFVDLCSSNGTDLAGKQLGVGWLEPGQVLSVGKIQLRLLGLSAGRGEEFLTVEEFAQRRLRKQADEYSRRLARLKQKSERRLRRKRKVWRSRYLALQEQVNELTASLNQMREMLDTERQVWQEHRKALEDRLQVALDEATDAVTLVSSQEHSNYTIRSSAQLALLEQRLNDIELQRQQERAQNALALAAEHLLLESEGSRRFDERPSSPVDHNRSSARPLVVKSSMDPGPASSKATDGLIAMSSSPAEKRNARRPGNPRPQRDADTVETMIRITRRLVSIDAKRRRQLVVIWACSIAGLFIVLGISTVLVRAYAPSTWNRCVPAPLHVLDAE